MALHDRAGGGVVEDRVAEDEHQRLVERDVDLGADADPLAAEERHRGAEGGGDAGDGVGEAERGAVGGVSGQPLRKAYPLAVSATVPKPGRPLYGAALAEAADPGHHQAGLGLRGGLHPMPHASMRPGRKFSMRTSAVPISRRATSRPPSSRMSSATDRLPEFSREKPMEEPLVLRLPLAGEVAAVGVLDLDDLRPEVAQHATGGGSGGDRVRVRE